MAEVPNFPVWRMIRLGTYHGLASLRRALAASGCSVTEWADDLLKNPALTLRPSPTKVDLVKCTVKDLGLPEGGPWTRVRHFAWRLDLAECPPEAGPQLCLQEKDSDDFLLLGMTPIADRDGYPAVFTVHLTGRARSLDAYHGGAEFVLSPNDKVLFARPQ